MSNKTLLANKATWKIVYKTTYEIGNLRKVYIGQDLANWPSYAGSPKSIDEIQEDRVRENAELTYKIFRETLWGGQNVTGREVDFIESAFILKYNSINKGYNQKLSMSRVEMKKHIKDNGKLPEGIYLEVLDWTDIANLIVQ